MREECIHIYEYNFYSKYGFKYINILEWRLTRGGAC